MNGSNDWSYDLVEHEKQQLLRDARTPFVEKLRWLEQAHFMVLEMERLRNRASKDTIAHTPTK